MDVIFLILTIIGIVVAIVFGFLQMIAPFVKREVRLSRRFPFVISLDAALDKLQCLLSNPFWFEIDPRWDRLREHPRFQELTR